jgi:hypothetical protein
MPWAMEVLLVLADRKRDEENQETSAVISRYRIAEKSYSGIGIFTVSQLSQSGIGIPASGSVRYRW